MIEDIDPFHELQKASGIATSLVHFDPHQTIICELKRFQKNGYCGYDVSCSGTFRRSLHPGLPSKPNALAASRTKVQPILLLNTAKRTYWPTELEVAGIVFHEGSPYHRLPIIQLPYQFQGKQVWTIFAASYQDR